MRARCLIAVVVALLGLSSTTSAASSDPATVSASQLRARFAALTGSKLLVDGRASSRGHYAALALPPSISNQGRYGQFTLYVVGPAHRSDDIARLLADAHTGALGSPGPSRIYWESGRYLSGERYWLAKKQYGANLVLWWYGSEPKVDKAFRRLHDPLRRLVSR